MKRALFLLALVSVFLLVACGGDAATNLEIEEVNEETPLPEAPDVNEPTPYPGPSESQDPGAYPGVALPTPPNPYPEDGETWLLRSWGRQCTDPSLYDFADLETAVAALEAAGVEVLESGETTLPMCDACNCATPEHFRVLVDNSDLRTALEMGWFRE